MSQYVRSQQRLDCYNMILVRLLQNVLYWANNFLNRILTYDVLYELWAHGHFIQGTVPMSYLCHTRVILLSYQPFYIIIFRNCFCHCILPMSVSIPVSVFMLPRPMALKLAQKLLMHNLFLLPLINGNHLQLIILSYLSLNKFIWSLIYPKTKLDTFTCDITPWLYNEPQQYKLLPCTIILPPIEEVSPRKSQQHLWTNHKRGTHKWASYWIGHHGITQ